MGIADALRSRQATMNQVADLFERYYTSNGWIPAGETWTYASANSINVPTGAGSRYAIGDKILMTNGTVKYFYVVGLADTVLTLTGGTDYTVANTAITANYVSRDSSPVAFPHWFNYTPTYTGFSTPPSSNYFRFCIRGRACKVRGVSLSNGTSDANFLTFTTPINSSNLIGGTYWFGTAQSIDNGVQQSTPAYLQLGAGSNVVNCYPVWSGGAWTTTGGKRLVLADIEFEI